MTRTPPHGTRSSMKISSTNWLKSKRFLPVTLPGILILRITSASAEEPMCTGTDLAAAQSAMSHATLAIDRAITAIDNPSKSDLDRLVTWFGVRSSADSQVVRQKLVSARVLANGAVYLCAVSTTIKLGDVYAYVRPDKSFAIVLGAFFFRAPERGFDSRPGTLVHEMTHFTLVGATKAVAYGIAKAKSLSLSNP